MSSPPPWQPLLRGAQPCDHIVQLYTDEAFLTRAVTQFIGAGLLAGEAAVIIATPAPHPRLRRAAGHDGGRGRCARRAIS